MDAPSDQIQSELENFRNQWRAEVSARAKNPSSSSSSSSKPSRRGDQSHKRSVPSRAAHHHHQLEDEDDTAYFQSRSFDEPGPSGHKLDDGDDDGDAELNGSATVKGKEKEPQFAIDFYEAAVEKETSGKLGDSLQLYRKAFRMDSRVDQIYKNKYFAAAWQHAAKPPTAPAPTTTTANQSSKLPPNAASAAAAAVKPEGPGPALLSLPDLIASFAETSIQGSAPEVEGAPPPPCPIAALPDEILVHVLRDVAVADVGDFVRLARVCRRLAYLVATEEQIWRRVCLGSEFGFAGMHYYFQQGVAWQPLEVDAPEPETRSGFGSESAAAAAAAMTTLTTSKPFEFYTTTEDPELNAASRRRRQQQQREDEEKQAATLALLHHHHLLLHHNNDGDPHGWPSWRAMFRSRPRVRFNGCYISTVNYIRAGQASGHQITWNSPVHIVTYYRYLRLFRDGAALSLLTTEEPARVVPHLTREAHALHRGPAAAPHLPSAVVAQALRGRWRLSGSAVDALEYNSNNNDNDNGDNGDDDDDDDAGGAPATERGGAKKQKQKQKQKTTIPTNNHRNLADIEGDLFIETEGVGPKYVYRMDLALRSASAGAKGGGGPRNTKLAWKGFWSYNKLTDDWAVFSLKNDKPFFFSRVKSYGFGD